MTAVREYRPDIDGLRAVAVLSVVAFHAFPRWMRGGFVGVDIFFVISGYLIGSIVIAAVESGDFRYADFYARRARRLFPALGLVLAACAILGWFISTPAEYAQLGKHAVAGALFASNLAFLGEAGYFGGSADAKPLLHLWSLAIEEQFYILWPALTALAWAWGRTSLWPTLLIAAASFAASVVLSASHPEVAFFSLRSRAWELMLGVVLAHLSLHRGNLLRAGGEPRAWLGVALLAAGLATIDDTRSFPGAWALLPTLGAALLISAGPRALVNRVLLAHPLLAWIGRISYPLYLWHWPLLVFGGDALDNGHSAAWRATLAAASIALAAITYEFVERPSRARTGWPIAACASLALMLSAGAAIYLTQGVPDRLDADQRAMLEFYDQRLPEWRYFTRNEIAAKYRDDCNFYDVQAFRAGRVTRVPVSTLDPSCHTAVPGARVVFLWGDSHAQQFNYGLSRILPGGWQILQVASSGCAPSLVDAPSGSDYCRQSNWFALSTIRAVKPEIVILGQHAGRDIETQRALARTLRGLGVRRVVVVGPVPRWSQPLPRIVARLGPSRAPPRMLEGLDPKPQADNAALLRAHAPDDPFEFVDAMAYFCDARGCATYFGDDPVLGLTAFDYDHLTPLASERFAADVLGPRIFGSPAPR